jgi:hypothetical protein
MRWQLERTLGYRWTHPLGVRDLQDRPLYHMILATDNEAGTKIMSAIYSKAVAENPALYDQARQETSGRFRLIPVEQIEPTARLRYGHRATLPPLDSSGRRISI